MVAELPESTTVDANNSMHGASRKQAALQIATTEIYSIRSNGVGSRIMWQATS